MRFFGGMLMAAGILLASLSGLCALAMMTTSSVGPHAVPAPMQAIRANATPLLIGLGLTLAGWILRRP